MTFEEMMRACARCGQGFAPWETRHVGNQTTKRLGLTGVFHERCLGEGGQVAEIALEVRVRIRNIDADPEDNQEPAATAHDIWDRAREAAWRAISQEVPDVHLASEKVMLTTCWEEQ